MSKTYRQILERELRDYERRVRLLHRRLDEACKERNALASRVERLEQMLSDSRFGHLLGYCWTPED